MDIHSMFYKFNGRAKYDATNEGVSIRMVIPFPKALVTEDMTNTKMIVFLGKYKKAYLQHTKFIPWQSDMVSIVCGASYDLLISLTITARSLKMRKDKVYPQYYEPCIMDELPF